MLIFVNLLHPCFPSVLRISESVMFFHGSKDAFNSLFSSLIDFFVTPCMPDIFCFLQIVFPDMSFYQFYMIFASCTFKTLWAISTSLTSTFILTITFSICYAVRKDLSFSGTGSMILNPRNQR